MTTPIYEQRIVFGIQLNDYEREYLHQKYSKECSVDDTELTWHDYIPFESRFGFPRLYPLLDELKPEWKDTDFEVYAKDQDLRWILGQEYGGSSIFTSEITKLEPEIMRDIKKITGDELQLRGKFKIHWGM